MTHEVRENALLGELGVLARGGAGGQFEPLSNADARECAAGAVGKERALWMLWMVLEPVFEPPRDSRRLHNLRGWSDGKVSQIFSRGAGARGEDAQGA